MPSRRTLSRVQRGETIFTRTSVLGRLVAFAIAGGVLAAAALRMHAERMNLSKRERRLAEHFTSAHPAIPLAEVVAQPEDIHDLDGLRKIGTLLGRQSP